MTHIRGTPPQGIEMSMAKGAFLFSRHRFRYLLLRADSRFAPSQWETALPFNGVSRWLDANLESALFTGVWYMASSPATPTLCLEQKSENFRDIIYATIVTKIIIFDKICYVAYHSAAKFKLSIDQPSHTVSKCGIGRSWRLKVKPNLTRGCRSNIHWKS